ncbi:hypothetical protein CYMTET_38230 [Cymbomonas tetramitiformis]|uniref:Uncharacterized protein n=1 Tax=Cymbomonas tetramitiformis TaxID=36881 RepID=A0AAE0CCC0_9CHLO|nr:hypothetical protein CYMTET_38230 [Cymbomonas tetramitiformis]
MHDFLVLVSSKTEVLRARNLASRVLVRLGIDRNEAKGQWEPTQLVEHLRLEVDLKAGRFHVTPARLQKIHQQAKALLSKASRQRRWLPARWLAALAGLSQSVYLAVPPARLYLREQHFVISTKQSSGAKVHSVSSLFARAVMLNLKHAARGFSDELRHLHITHLELEAVYKTVQSFLRELTGKVVRLCCDNQAVVAMLSHFTSRNPELMRCMQRLWILLDLNDIELQARWFTWVEQEWHRHTVDRFDSEFSTKLPRYYAQWYDPGFGSSSWRRWPTRWQSCPGARTYSFLAGWEGPTCSEPQAGVGRRDVPHFRLPVSCHLQHVRRAAAEAQRPELVAGSRVSVYWPVDDAWYSGTVGATTAGLTDISYDNGDQEHLNMNKQKYEILTPAQPQLGGWDEALQQRWRGELGDSSLMELAVQMQAAALGGKTVGNYRPMAKTFQQFYVTEGQLWLPATDATVRLYIA